ncbi:MAG: phenylalanine--tRNA ligase subunit alpha [Candidatus Omnitrophota bacterium]
MIEALKELEKEAQGEVSPLSDPDLLQELKTKYLGRKGLFAAVTARISEVPPEERRRAGQEMNRVKQALEALFSEKEKSLKGRASAARPVDVSMPGTFRPLGTLHPLSQVTMEISAIFERLGFSVQDGPEAEDEKHNFEDLNIPLDHPARDGFDTFYLSNGKLLRSQTSTVQIRFMERKDVRPPFKIIAPGKVFRPDATDATHSFMFHQIEGLMVDERVSFADLKGVLFAFARRFFGEKTKLRFRPHFFPFTEPSAEVDIFWESKKAWLEILGAGMVHPNVLRAVKIDPEKYTGFAFGMGVERIAMLKYGVEDIRYFFENDLRFLRQFS